MSNLRFAWFLVAAFAIGCLLGGCGGCDCPADDARCAPAPVTTLPVDCHLHPELCK